MYFTRAINEEQLLLFVTNFRTTGNRGALLPLPDGALPCRSCGSRCRDATLCFGGLGITVFNDRDELLRRCALRPPPEADDGSERNDVRHRWVPKSENSELHGVPVPELPLEVFVEVVGGEANDERDHQRDECREDDPSGDTPLRIRREAYSIRREVMIDRPCEGTPRASELQSRTALSVCRRPGG